jgi:hypothetical protein
MSCIATHTHTQERDAGIKQRLFEEFNTLSVMYHMPAEKFIDVEHREKHTAAAIEPIAPTTSTSGDSQEPGAAGTVSNGDGGDGGLVPAAAAAAVPEVASSGDVVEGELLGDLLGFEDSSPAPVASTPPLPTTSSAPNPVQKSWQLKSNPTVDQGTYQTKWEALPAHSFDLQLQQAPSDASLIESMMASECISCMASGDVGTHLKLYFFAQADTGGAYFFAEMIVDKSSAALSATVKGEDAGHVSDFEAAVRRAIAPLV